MSRFVPDGVSFVAFLPAVASLAAPTTGEIAAGIVLAEPGSTLVAGLKEMSGWETSATNPDVPDVSSKFTGKIPGRQTGGEGVSVHYDDDSSTTIRTALAEGTVGFMLIGKSGRTAGKRCEVWPVTVSTIADSPVNSSGDPATFSVMYAQTRTPSKTAVMPA
jgi:hypothetical protein